MSRGSEHLAVFTELSAMSDKTDYQNLKKDNTSHLL